MKSAKSEAEKIKEALIDNKNQQTVFSENRLSWQNIILTSEKWANTDNSWKSVLVLIIFAFLAIMIASAILNTLYGL